MKSYQLSSLNHSDMKEEISNKRKIRRSANIWKVGNILVNNHWVMEKAMTSYSSTLTWKIPWMEEPSRLQSMGSLRVRHDWATSLSLFTFMNWRRKWQPTPVFLPGESQGRGNLVGCCLWGSHRVRHDWSDFAAAAATTESKKKSKGI